MGKIFAQWNPTTWILIGAVIIIILWELAVYSNDCYQWTVTETLRSWSPVAVLIVMIGFVILFWHVWVTKQQGP
jgi:hypothetical protein